MKKKTTTKVSDKKRTKVRRSRHVTSVTSQEARQMRDQTDWARVDAMTDNEIGAAIASDPTAAPPFEPGFLSRAAILMPPVGAKKPIAFRVRCTGVLQASRTRLPGENERCSASVHAVAVVVAVTEPWLKCSARVCPDARPRQYRGAPALAASS